MVNLLEAELEPLETDRARMVVIVLDMQNFFFKGGMR